MLVTCSVGKCNLHG